MFASNATTSAHVPYLVRHIIPALFGVMMVFANGAVILSVCKMGKHRQSLHLWIANLAITDAVTGVTLVIKETMELAFPDNEVLCRLLFIVATTSIGCSGSSSLTMSAKSFYSIKQATTLTFAKKTTPCVTMARMTGIWAFFLISNSLGLSYLEGSKDNGVKDCRLVSGMFSKRFILYMFIVMNIITAGIVFFQVRIYVLVKQHFRNMVSSGVILKTKIKHNLRNKETLETVSAKIDADLTQISCNTSERVLANDADSKFGETRACFSGEAIGEIKGEQKGKVLKDIVPKASLYETRKAQVVNLAKLVSIVVVLFVICWLPCSLGFLLYVLCNDRMCSYYDVYFSTTNTVIFLNSLMNPIVYIFKSPEIRRNFKRILHR